MEFNLFSSSLLFIIVAKSSFRNLLHTLDSQCPFISFFALSVALCHP